MNAAIAAFLSLVSGILCILALRGLSNPETSRTGNYLGMAGMAIAIGTTLALAAPGWLGIVLIILGIAIGGGIGVWRARTIAMTAMPQLVAMFHSLVGLAAVLFAAGAFYAPESFRLEEGGVLPPGRLIRLSIGIAIGAVSFQGQHHP